MNNEGRETEGAVDGRAALEPPQELDGEPAETPSCEMTTLRFSIRTVPGAEIDPEVRRVAEFWLTVADGDALWALVLACERMSQIPIGKASAFAAAEAL